MEIRRAWAVGAPPKAQSHSLRHWEWLIRPFSFGPGFHCRRPRLFGVTTHHSRNPPDDTGLVRFGRCFHLLPARHWHWNGADWLDPLGALVILPDDRPTENQLAEEVQRKHDAYASPVAEDIGREQVNRQPVPQEHKQPTLETEDAEQQSDNEGNAYDNDESGNKAPASIVQRGNRILH